MRAEVQPLDLPSLLRVLVRFLWCADASRIHPFHRITRRYRNIAVPIIVFVMLSMSLSACADLPPQVAVPVEANGATTSFDGFTITPVEVEPEDWAEILDIRRWQFDIDAEADLALNYQLEIRQPGGETSHLAGFGVNTTSDFEGDALIALYPIADDFYHADTLKYYIRSGGASTARTFENPFKGWAASKPNQPADMLETGVYELMLFSKEGVFPGPDNAQIVLIISNETTL
jgi:hypothetical protein